MKSWVMQGLVYDFNPSLYNYIKLKFLHFHFCRKNDPTIDASLYLDNLAEEVKHKIAEQKSVNKKSLILAIAKNILENRNAKQAFIVALERKPFAQDQEIKEFLNQINDLIDSLKNEKEQIADQEEVTPTADFPVRTYVIATHIYLEINNNELHYETLIRDTTALKDFISAKFKLSRIPGRIEEMKSFSYKKILQSKSAVSAKGQLIPQIRQIALHPVVFGKEVSAFAESILKEHFPSKK